MEHKLFGWRLDYANGQTDHGLIVATDAETARLHMENYTFSGVKAVTIVDQLLVVDIINQQYNGVAVFTTETSCN